MQSSVIMNFSITMRSVEKKKIVGIFFLYYFNKVE